MKLLLLFCLFCMSEAYKILVVFPMPGKSHAILGQGFVDTLSQAGHEITYITAFPVEKPAANVQQVDISSTLGNIPPDVMKITNLVNSPFRAHMGAIMGSFMAIGVLEHENVQKLLDNTSQQFDIVIVEWFYTAVLSGFASVYKAPLIWVSSMEPHWQVLELVDEPCNPAYTASVLTTVTPPFGFFDRVSELVLQLYVKFVTAVVDLVLVKPAYNKHFGPAFEKRGDVVPPFSEVAHNGSFMFINGQPVLSTGFRLTQNVKYIGGYHIDPNTKPLPENLKKIFDTSRHGVVYFSMGSNLKSKDMSEGTKRGLLKMFGTLKETVLWKFEEELKDLPPNVHIVQWAPQNSILNHPKTKVFISHGGKLSTTETIHYGVPVIGVPIFGDQFANMDQAVAKGYGIKIKYDEDLATPLKAALDQMLNNSSYAETAKKISSIYHDVIASPRKELLHWAEHVARTKGAPHLRSIALEVPWYQKIYLDLIAVRSRVPSALRLGSTDPHWQALEVIDEASNPAYTAGILTQVIPPFNFWERVEELLSQLHLKPLLFLAHVLLERRIYNRCFGPAFEVRGLEAPAYSSVAYNASFMFFNGQPVLSVGYRLPQNTRYIGGYHIDPNTKPLPENLKKIFDNSKHGVIYFSMGSNLQSKDMHDSTVQELIKLFGTLKETVIWKFEGEIKDSPPNLHIVNWAPQPSILNHSKTLMFITHGGKLSTTEAIYYGVPVIGIPIFGDQFLNMEQAVAKGYGLKVDYEENLAKPLEEAIDEMIKNTSYYEKAKQISAIFHDSIAPPRKELLHWVEHVVKTKGAPHLQSIAFFVPWYQKMYLDLMVLIAMVFYVLRKLVRHLRKRRSEKPQIKDSKKKN